MQVLVKVELEEEVVDDAGGIACIRSGDRALVRAARTCGGGCGAGANSLHQNAAVCCRMTYADVC
jgi:hypothetical protein